MALKHGIILLKKCRPINLLTIILLQCFIYFFLFYNILESFNIGLRLSLTDLILLTIDLAFIMGAGYLINDLYDLKTDQAHSNKISLQETGVPLIYFKRTYWIISTLGMLLTLYLANKYNEWALSLLYPVGTYILYIYAKKLKSTILLGNLLIAVLCIFPTLMIYLAEAPGILKLKASSPTAFQFFTRILSFYLLFSFLSTLIREIIKDLEDKEADKQAELTTFANSYPLRVVLRVSKVLILLFIFVQLCFCLYLFLEGLYLGVLFFIICIFPMTIFSLLKLRSAKTESDFNKLSKLYKLIILTGILLLVFIR